MSGYNAIERGIARIAGRFPGLKAVAKQIYTATNYAVFAEAGFTHQFAPGVALTAALGGRDTADERFCGYFEPSPFSADGARLLHHRRRDGLDELDIMLVEADGSERMLGSTRAFSLQQGARLQWLPDSSTRLVYNEVRDGVLGSCWRDLEQARESFLPWPVAALSPDGACFASLDFVGLAKVAPDYGYAVDAASLAAGGTGRPDPGATGVWLADIGGVDLRLACSLARVLRVAPEADMAGARQELNHVSFAPDGASFVFIHRWVGRAGRSSRLLRYRIAEDALDPVLQQGMVSHFGWTPAGGLAVYARVGGVDGYHLLDAQLADPLPLAPGQLDAWGDGHPTVSSDGRLLLTDSYPDRRRQQHLLLHDLASARTLELGRLLSPLAFSGVRRVDLHPRFSRDGRRVCIDSTHLGARGVYVLDVSAVLAPWLDGSG